MSAALPLTSSRPRRGNASATGQTSRSGLAAQAAAAVRLVPHNAQANGKFTALGHPRRIWVVGAIHAELEKLQALHDEIASLFKAGDRLIYLGNYIGIGTKTLETISELLDFRRALIATEGVFASDVVYLRGGQEEMWSKLLQIQFAPNPVEVMQWLLRQGAEPTLLAYRGNPQQGLAAARDGVMAMTRWTSLLRAEVRVRAGHEAFFSALRRAAYTGNSIERSGSLLFVNAGLDTAKPLANQGDSFWWGAPNWTNIIRPYGAFSKIIRGFDPLHGGPAQTSYTLTVDGGAGYNGTIVGACLSPTGDVLDMIEI